VADDRRPCGHGGRPGIGEIGFLPGGRLRPAADGNRQGEAAGDTADGEGSGSGVQGELRGPGAPEAYARRGL
jgi:hypothetical protein